MSSTTKMGPLVGSVPGPGGAAFLPAMAPASASAGRIIQKRPKSMARPRAVLYQGVFALMPAKAEPLLAVALVKAYRISLRPCGPALLRDDRPYGTTADQAARARMTSGKMSA